MDDLAFLRERIESYAEYTNEDARELSDEQIRAFVGEALARALERLQPAGPVAQALSNTLLRCQFADQREVRAFKLDDVDPAEVAETMAADVELVRLADCADSVDADGLAALLGKIDAALDRRWQIAFGASRVARPVPPR